MYREPNVSIEIQDFLALSAHYFRLETDRSVACAARTVAPYTARMRAGRSPTTTTRRGSVTPKRRSQARGGAGATAPGCEAGQCQQPG